MCWVWVPGCVYEAHLCDVSTSRVTQVLVSSHVVLFCFLCVFMYVLTETCYIFLALGLLGDGVLLYFSFFYFPFVLFVCFESLQIC